MSDTPYIHDATWVSKLFTTNNPYIKYALKIETYEALYTENAKTSEIQIGVYALSDNSQYSQSEPNAYECTIDLMVDDGIQEEYTSTGDKIQSGTVSAGKSGHITGGTLIYNDGDHRSIRHEMDGTKELHIEAKITIAKNGETIAESLYQGFYVKLKTLPGSMHSTISVYYITEHNMAINVVLGAPTEVHGDPRGAPLPGDPHYYIFFYSINNGVSWTYVGYTTIPRDEQGYQQNGYPEMLVEIRGLDANTTYPIVLAMRDNLGIPPVDIDDPSETPDAYLYSSRMNLTTLGINPLPDIPSTRGFARRITLFEQTEQQFISNGIGSLIEAFSCKVTEEINGMFELEMEYPVDGRHFNDIDFGRIITANPNQYSRPQPFRIYGISKPHDGKVTINAQHISYDLSGITVKPFVAGSPMGVLGEFRYGIGGVCDVPCPFQFWTDLSVYSEFRVNTPATIRSLLGGSDSSLLGMYGGEYEYDVFNVRLWTKRGTDRGVTIRYGKNLTSLKQESNCNNVYTGVRPFWYKEPGDVTDPETSSEEVLKSGLVDLPEKIIYIDGTFDYDKILLLDLSSEFDEKPTVEDLRAAAVEYIVVNNIGVPEVSLSISFVQLADSLEYRDIAVLEQIKLGDYVSVEFPKLNITAHGIECVKTVFNVLSQRYDSIDLGTPKSTLANTVSNNSKAASSAVSRGDIQHIINVSSEDSTKEQTYVVMDQSSSPARLLVMDAPRSNIAVNIYKWSFDGWSHSSTGIGGPYTKIASMDASKFNWPGEINCTKLTQTTPNMVVNGKVLKILRW